MTRKLKISDALSLPIDAVTQRISILGRTRSGKSHTAGVIVEEVLKARQQVVILDPKGDWWGLRSSSDGKSAGLPITIMGGRHGDIPLEPTAGSLVADIVVNEGVSLVLDLSLFDSKADEVRFVTAFLDRLYRKNTEPVLLVIDEADVFAPQKPEKNETTMLNRMETICRRGAGRGIGVVLISQRSASLHKGCLSQTELMIAHQTTAPQDKDAIKEWVVDHGDEERRESFMKRIPKLPKGTAIAWSPAWLEIYKEIAVRRKETYDSGDAPRVGKRRRPPKVLAQVDLERLKKHMTATIEKARQEDPRLLRAEIEKLKAELAAKPKPVVPPPAQVKAAPVQTVIKERVVEVPVVGKREIRKLEKMVERIEKAQSYFGFSTQALEIATRSIQAIIGRMDDHSTVDERRKSAGLPPLKRKEASVKPEPVKVEPTRKPAVQSNGNGEGLEKCERAVLGVLAQYDEGCGIDKLALLSGYRQSGSFKTVLTNLRNRGLMEGENSETMRITVSGRSVLGDDYVRLPTGRALAEYWLRHPSFGPCERKVLESLLESKNGLTMDELCSATGYQPSGSFKTSLTSLRTAGVMIGKNGEKMKASEALL